MAFFDWFLENKGPYPGIGVQETEHATGEINVWCKKIAPLFMPYETLLASSFGCRAGDWPSSWVISSGLLPELSLPWWSAHPSSTSYFSPPFPSHVGVGLGWRWAAIWLVGKTSEAPPQICQGMQQDLESQCQSQCHIFQSLGARVVARLRAGERRTKWKSYRAGSGPVIYWLTASSRQQQQQQNPDLKNLPIFMV